MAEELAFQKLFGDRGGVDGDEGLARRGPLMWMARATTSLPVPLSPVTRTVVREGATLGDGLGHRLHGGRDADQPLNAVAPLQLAAQPVVVAQASCRRSALATVASSSSISIGLPI